MCLSGSQFQSNWATISIDKRMDFGRHPTARATHATGSFVFFDRWPHVDGRGLTRSRSSGYRVENARPVPRMTPSVEAIYTGRIRTISSWNVCPWRTCYQPPEYTVQNTSIVNPSLTTHFGRKKRFNHRPFEICSIKTRHHCPHVDGDSGSQTIQSQNYFMGM